MIGQLPTELEVDGKLYGINSDFRVMLNIYAAFADPELTDLEKCYVCMKNLYVDYEKIPRKSLKEAADKAYWFAGGGDNAPDDNIRKSKILDWEQDERIIFPAVNKAAGFETRSVPYLHWWSFLGLFGEIGEGLFSQVVHIREKKAKGKKLEKWEQEFLRENKSLVEIKRKYTKEEREEQNNILALFS